MENVILEKEKALKFAEDGKFWNRKVGISGLQACNCESGRKAVIFFP